ncbi:MULTISPECIES: Piwi domain-containing protein [Aequorivita]|uniref:Protein argonaute n=2 Tax=Aequorivita TaxID=153265 RepID=A0AB35YZU5_9FLAO|nr:Piwi domain-containing protein [Aequorivita sp. Ant34-E75]WGF92142.1 Piwi domain-containing protein [Aequorivita sp. Ant34-E75]
MQEHIKFNALNFNWPRRLLTFYVSLQKSEGDDTIYYKKFPKSISEVFSKIELEGVTEIYTTFTNPKDGFKPLKIDFNNANLSLYKQYLNAQIRKYFDNLNIINRKNRIIKDRQVWVLNQEYHKDYHCYDKFSIKVQIAEISDYPELIISFDGTSKVLKKSVQEIESSQLVKTAVYRNQIINFQMNRDTPEKETFFNSLILNEIYPVLNGNLQKELGIPFQIKKIKNRYTAYLEKIQKFTKEYLFTEAFKQICDLRSEEFIDAPINRIGHIPKEKALLEYGKDNFGNKQTGISPKLELKNYRPYSRPPNQNIKFFFIYHAEHKPLIKKLWDYLKKGTGYSYKGLKEFIDIPVNSEPDNFIEFTNKENPLPQIEQRLYELQWDKSVAYLAFYISPYTRFESNPQLKNIYYRIKELFLDENIMTQVIDFEDLQRNISDYQWHLNNISLAIHAKLGGKPWKLAVTDKKELIIGVGAFTNLDHKHRYVASAFSFQNNGIFNKFDCFSKDQTEQLAGSISKAIRTFFNQSEADKIVIHFYKEMSKEELEPILRVMSKLKLENKPIYILNINKTETKDIIAYDIDSDSLMPYSGTFIRLGERNFLLFNNGRFEEEKFYPSDGYPFPIKIGLSSPTPDAFEDDNVITELLTQAFQFSRLYWKSLKPQNVPITIKYPAMVAQLVPRFQTGIEDESKDKLWFL